MASQSDPRRTRPATRFPAAVLLRAAAQPWQSSWRTTRPCPGWWVSLWTWGGHSPIRSALRPANVPVVEELALLILAPANAVEVRTQFHGPDGAVFVPSRWSPVVVVPTERHDPDAGLVCPALFPTLVFEESL